MSIVLRDLTKRYGPHAVVDRVSVEIAQGELFVLLGASGSGKSTILRMIAGLAGADEGRVLLHGQDVTELPPQRRNTGLVFQNYALFQHMTVAENVVFGLSVRHVPRAERAAKRDELLALVGLAGLAARLPRQLSGGQQQRVAVARALAYQPSVLLLDEPFGALDVKIRGQLRRALKSIQRSLGVTTILVTHDQEEAFELADRIGVVERGRLLEVGSPTQLYHKPRHEFVASFVGEANLLGARSEGGHLRLGELRLPLPITLEDLDPGVRWAVLLRPEDLVLANEREDLDAPVLGHGVVEEVLAVGASERVRVRLETLPGAWPLGTDYGEIGVVLRAAVSTRGAQGSGFHVDQTVWVGVRSFHLLPRLARRLLLWTDGSPAAEGALRLGASLARSIAGVATVLCVAANEMIGERLVARTREALTKLTPRPLVKAGRGECAEEVLRELSQENYDLVVVPGWNGPDRGESTAESSRELAGRSPIPVLVANQGRPSIRRMLLCTAAGEPGKLDVAFGGQLARRTDAEATLLYVDAPEALVERHANQRNGALPPGGKRPRAWIERHLEQGVQTLSGQGVRAGMKVRRGPVVDEILSEANEGDYDLIVIGGHIARTWLDSPERDMTAQLLDRADRPVLVVQGGLDR
jgi:sulfate transport system ATP-binding protein